jgi:hypothetical protein
MQDASRGRESLISENYQSELQALRLEEIQQEVKNMQMFGSSREHHWKKEIQDLQKELTESLKQHQKLMRQLEAQQKEYNWQLMMNDKQNDKYEKICRKHESLLSDHQMLIKYCQNLEQKLEASNL